MAINRIHIKNMVCPRCITSVKTELENLGYHVLKVDLGFADIEEKIDLDIIKSVLAKNGFEVLEDKNSLLTDRIKRTIISIIHSQNIPIGQKLSDVLTKRIGVDYHTLSHTFSSAEGVTIERYYILQRIERVKELLQYNQQSMKEIAYQLGFSSVAHLSSQFKKETGISPGVYKETQQSRKPIHDILH